MGVNYNPKIVTDGLVLCLDAGNPKSYPGSGNVWYDLSGKNNNCNWNVLPTFSNTYFTFTGTQYGTITNNSTLDFSAEQSILIVMKHTYTSGRKNPWDQAYGGYGTWTHEQGNYINCYFGDSGANSRPYLGYGSPTTSRSVWNFMCHTRNTSEARWYINDVNPDSRSHSYGTLTQTNANIRIGRGYAGYWQGDMAFVAAYTSSLSENQVKQNFNALRGRYGI